MFFLPKGSPLFETMAIARRGLPDILNRLRSVSFSGYVSFLFPASRVIALFESGRLGALLHHREGHAWHTSPQALAELAELMLSVEGGVMNGYTLSPRLCACVRGLIRGSAVYRAQELKLLNIGGLLHQIRSDRFTGCLRTYTEERSCLIFYQEGEALGFFHDGSPDLETTATDSQRIASLAGAKIDLYVTRGMGEPLERDLLDEVNTRELWESAVTRHQREGTGGDEAARNQGEGAR